MEFREQFIKIREMCPEIFNCMTVLDSLAMALRKSYPDEERRGRFAELATRVGESESIVLHMKRTRDTLIWKLQKLCKSIGELSGDQ
jgi:hypothetical protein